MTASMGLITIISLKATKSQVRLAYFYLSKASKSADMKNLYVHIYSQFSWSTEAQGPTICANKGISKDVAKSPQQVGS